MDEIADRIARDRTLLWDADRPAAPGSVSHCNSRKRIPGPPISRAHSPCRLKALGQENPHDNGGARYKNGLV
jgi:hypothetical protein